MNDEITNAEEEVRCPKCGCTEEEGFIPYSFTSTGGDIAFLRERKASCPKCGYEGEFRQLFGGF